MAEAAQHAQLERQQHQQQQQPHAHLQPDAPGQVPGQIEDKAAAPKPKQAPAQLSLAKRQLQKVDKRGMSALTTFFTKKVKPNRLMEDQPSADAKLQ